MSTVISSADRPRRFVSIAEAKAASPGCASPFRLSIENHIGLGPFNLLVGRDPEIVRTQAVALQCEPSGKRRAVIWGGVLA